MKNRKALQPNTKLGFTNCTGGQMHYVVSKEIGRGGSCIVYEGYYINNAGSANVVRIKECYPYKLNITRSENGMLCMDENDKKEFQKYKQRLKQAFDVAMWLRQTTGLANYVSDVFDIYEANNTLYIVSSYIEGCTLQNTEFVLLKDIVKAVISTAKSIEKIHDRGYLYLDIKPENIFTYEETFELIQLFDFDSVIPIDAYENITEYKISYSVGFSPMEQKEGRLSRIGKYTDVYGLGALMYYLMFRRVPTTIECSFDSVYDYDSLKWDVLYQKKLRKAFDEFYHNTLQTFYLDRYQTMAEAIEQLKVIQKYAEIPEPFIRSCYVTNNGAIVGRKIECDRLLNWYESDENVIFITGMGGIGKSTIVRKFLDDNKDKFDNIIYLQYRDSIFETIVDDEQFYINGYEKDDLETVSEYFERKINVAKELTAKDNSILIIDNFNGNINEEFECILNVNWKIIVVTRWDMSESDYLVQRVDGFRDSAEQYLLFENNMGRKLKYDEYSKLNRIIQMVAGHTLSLVLIARQIARSFMDVDNALRLVENCGFSDMAPEKIKYMQDTREFYDKISSIIMSVYDVSGLSEIKKKCMKVLSIFDAQGIDANEAKALLKLESFDDINELVDMGWLEASENNIGMHPLIQEIMQQISWTDECRGIATYEMDLLYERINMNVNKRKNLWVAKSVLLHTGKDSILREKEIYKNLLFATLINMPKEYEEYIINNCEKIFQDNEFRDKYSIIELYDYVVYLECQRSDIGGAKNYLARANAFASSEKDNYVWGIYYDMLSDYYDEILSGAYYSDDYVEREIFSNLLSAMENASRYMGKSRHEKAKKLYAKYMLSRASLMIRGMDNKHRKIKALISSIKTVVVNPSAEYDEIRSIYNMVLAWYYTLCEPKKEVVLKYLREVYENNKGRNLSQLDEIDCFYIPAANMMFELGESQKSLELLDVACNICDEYEDLAPYIRKKNDLINYKLEVCSED